MKLEELMPEQRLRALLDMYPVNWPCAVGAVKEMMRTAAREAAVAAIERAAKECDIVTREIMIRHNGRHDAVHTACARTGSRECATAIRSLTIEDET